MCPHCEPDGLRLPDDELPPKCRAHESRSPLKEARAAGAAEERARIVAMLRAEAAALDKQSGSAHWALGVALEALADRIERGEP
jgi:hypothetical protein